MKWIYLFQQSLLNGLYHDSYFSKDLETFCKYIFVIFITLCILGNVSCCCCPMLTFLKINYSGTLSECESVWIQIRTDVLLVLIGIQVGKELTLDGKYVFPPFFLLTFCWLLSCWFNSYPRWGQNNWIVNGAKWLIYYRWGKMTEFLMGQNDRFIIDGAKWLHSWWGKMTDLL